MADSNERDGVALRLFGVIHIDSAEKVAAELDDYADGADALFVEAPETEIDERVVAETLVRTPLFGVGVLAYSLVLYVCYALVNRDLRASELLAVERVADRRGLPVHYVDDHPMLVASRAGWRWSVTEWLAVAGVVALAPSSVVPATVVALGFGAIRAVGRRSRRAAASLAVVVPVAVLSASMVVLNASLWLLLAGVLGMYVAMLATLSHRNEHMLDRIAAVSDREGYDRACHVTGKAHLSGLIAGAPAHGVDVVRSKTSKLFRRSDAETADPEPESGDWADAVGAFSRERPVPAMGTESAVVGQRVGAAVLDSVVAVAAGVVGLFAVGLAAGVALGDGAIETGMYVGLLATPFAYPVVAEAAFGRTLGKRLVGLVVATEDGGPCTGRAALVRNLLRPIDFLFFYGVGYAVMASTERSQRLGDLAADTVVVGVADAAEREEPADAPEETDPEATAKPAQRTD